MKIKWEGRGKGGGGGEGEGGEGRGGGVRGREKVGKGGRRRERGRKETDLQIHNAFYLIIPLLHSRNNQIQMKSQLRCFSWN